LRARDERKRRPASQSINRPPPGLAHRPPCKHTRAGPRQPLQGFRTVTVPDRIRTTARSWLWVHLTPRRTLLPTDRRSLDRAPSSTGAAGTELGCLAFATSASQPKSNTCFAPRQMDFTARGQLTGRPPRLTSTARSITLCPLRSRVIAPKHRRKCKFFWGVRQALPPAEDRLQRGFERLPRNCSSVS